MDNLQDYIKCTKALKQFQVDELLFAEFKCPVQEAESSIWWHNNFFAYVVSGETRLQTRQKTYTLSAGDCAFAKKGSVIIHSQLRDDFCELLVFVPDDFIKTIVQKHKLQLGNRFQKVENDMIIPLSKDALLTTYFNSLLLYFELPKAPPKKSLKLKFEELIVNIVSNNDHMPLTLYLGELCSRTKPSIKDIMEANFCQNLSIQEFARLCSRSLSAFKSEFKTLYQGTPGTWLRERRLEHSKYLLEISDKSVSEIMDHSGFENPSHFIRIFKSKYGLSPGNYRTRLKNK